MKFPILLAVFSAFIAFSGCSSNSSSPLIAGEGVRETTGYWYLGDNGKRQWRSFTSDVNSDGNPFKKNITGVSPFGNGSGQ